VYNILDATCKITLTHPKYIKAIRGKKTDKRMPSGLLICLSMTSLPEALCRPSNSSIAGFNALPF